MQTGWQTVDPDQTALHSLILIYTVYPDLTVRIFRIITIHFCIRAASWQNQQNDLCAQRRLRSAWASAQSDQSSQRAQWVAEDPMFLHADSEDSDQTGQMPRLIWVFAGRKGHFVGFVMRRLNLIIKQTYLWQSCFLSRFNRFSVCCLSLVIPGKKVENVLGTPMPGRVDGLGSETTMVDSTSLTGPRQANLCLRAFRHDKL